MLYSKFQGLSFKCFSERKTNIHFIENFKVAQNKHKLFSSSSIALRRKQEIPAGLSRPITTVSLLKPHSPPPSISRPIDFPLPAKLHALSWIPSLFRILSLLQYTSIASGLSFKSPLKCQFLQENIDLLNNSQSFWMHILSIKGMMVRFYYV